MFKHSAFLAIILQLNSCGSSHYSHSSDPAPQPHLVGTPPSSNPAPVQPQNPSSSPTLASEITCSPLPPVTDRSLPLYGNWAAPKIQDGKSNLSPVFAFRSGRAVIQLTCASTEGIICVQAETLLEATETRFKLPESFPVVSRTINNSTCTIKKRQSIFDMEYRLSGSKLILKDFLDREIVWERIN